MGSIGNVMVIIPGSRLDMPVIFAKETRPGRLLRYLAFEKGLVACFSLFDINYTAATTTTIIKKNVNMKERRCSSPRRTSDYYCTCRLVLPQFAQKKQILQQRSQQHREMEREVHFILEDR